MDENDPEADKTSIYGALDWDEDTARTVLTVLIAFGVASPILFLVLWIVSLYNPMTCRFDGSLRKCVCARPEGLQHDIIHAQQNQKHGTHDSESTELRD